jgi:hypothetical protein
MISHPPLVILKLIVTTNGIIQIVVFGIRMIILLALLVGAVKMSVLLTSLFVFIGDSAVGDKVVDPIVGVTVVGVGFAGEVVVGDSDVKESTTASNDATAVAGSDAVPDPRSDGTSDDALIGAVVLLLLVVVPASSVIVVLLLFLLLVVLPSNKKSELNAVGSGVLLAVDASAGITDTVGTTVYGSTDAGVGVGVGNISRSRTKIFTSLTIVGVRVVMIPSSSSCCCCCC